MQIKYRYLFSSNGKAVVLVDHSTYEWAAHLAWTPNVGGKMRTGMHGRLLLHRIITNAPDSLVVDHINRNHLDNRRENLRICTNSQNLMNSSKHKDSSSGFKGVCRCRSKTHPWRAYIVVDYKQKHLGNFKTAEEAARAYNEAAQELHGIYANLNTLD